MTLWGQDTAQRDFNAMLFTRKGSDNANLVRKMRWRDSLPVRYIEFEASQCGREENLKYKDTARRQSWTSASGRRAAMW